MPRKRRRRAVHPSRDAFEAVVDLVEGAKRDLLTAMPSPRGVPGRAVADALASFEEGLREADDAMSSWRTPETEDAWRACAGAVRRSLDSAERLRLEAPSLDYEGLVAVLGDLMAPLEAFEAADHSLR